MIGEQGWVVHFVATGSTQRSIQQVIVDRLEEFWPATPGDGWRMDVDCMYVENPQADAFEAHVTAMRVKVDATSHEVAGATVDPHTVDL